MLRYQVPTPRIAFGAAAMAMTVVTLCALVVLPSLTQSEGQTSAMLAASSGASRLRAVALSQLHGLRSRIVGTQKSTEAASRS